MKIIKYILIVGILLTLYITEPMWRVQPNTNDTEMSSVDKEILEQKTERNNLIAAEAEKGRIYEEKFGKRPSVAYKSRVPKPLQDYWDKTLNDNESIYEDICSPLKASNKGWKTTCQYKIRSEKRSSGLKFNTYIIKNGIVVR